MLATGSKCCSSFPWLRQKREPIIPILAHLQLLLVNFKIEYKVLTLVFLYLKGLAPTCIADQKTNQGTQNYSVAANKPSSGCHIADYYIADLIWPYSPQRSLRTSYDKLLTCDGGDSKLVGPITCTGPKGMTELRGWMEPAEEEGSGNWLEPECPTKRTWLAGKERSHG